MSDRPVNVNIRLALDQAALQQSAAGVDDIQKTLDTFRATLNDTGNIADKVGPNVADALSTVKTSASDATDQVKALNSALESTSQTAATISSSASKGLGSFDVGNLRTAGRALNQLGAGGIGRPLQQLGDIGIITQDIEKLGASLSGLGGVFGNISKDAYGLTQSLSGVEGPLTASTAAFSTIIGVIAPLVAAGAILVGGLTLIKNAYADNTKVIEQALTQLDAYYKAIDGGTKDTLQKQLNAAEAHKKSVDDELATTQNAQNGAFQSAQQNYGDLGARILEAAGSTGLYGDTLKDTNAKQADLTKQSSDLAGQIDALKQAMGSSAVAANDAKVAEDKLQAVRDQNANISIAQARQDAQLVAAGSSKSVEAQIADIQAAKKAIDDVSSSSGLSKDETLKLAKQWNDLTDQENDLTNNVLPLIKAREAETQATKDQVKAADDIIKARKQQQDQEVAAVNKYNNAVTAANDAAATARLSADDKLNTAIQTADDNEAQALITAHQKYNDALVTAAQNAVDAASKALEGLQQKQADNLTSYNRDTTKSQRDQQNQLLDDQIKAHRTEVSDLQTHLDNLKQIRDRDSAREQNDLLNRNFLDLVSLRFGKTQDMNKENDRYTKQEEQLQTSLKNQEDDQARSFDQQRQSRAIAYQNANADALKQYHRELENAQDAKEKAIKLAQAAENKELQVAEDAHTKALQSAQNAHIKELNLIVQNTTAKLKLLYDGAVAELKLINQTEAAKLKIYQNSLKQAQSMAGNTSVVYDASPSGVKTPGKYKPFAAGGMIGAGQRALVNDGGGTEGFNGVKFPPGLGLFIPTQSGYINSASGGKNINMSITVNAAQDPIATAQFVKAHVADALHKVMGD